MSVIHVPEETALDARQLLIPAVLALVFTIFFCRLWYLQVVQAEELRDRANRTGEVRVDKLAPRGQIVDRKGRLLAGVKPDLVVTVIPDQVRKRPELVSDLAATLGVEEQRIAKAVKDGSWRPYLPAAVYVGATVEAASRIVEAPERFPGVSVQTQPMRYYTRPVSLSQVLGYVWTPTGKDEERLKKLGVQPAQYVGRDGVESRYERELMGQPGSERMTVDALRRPLRTSGVDHSVPGQRLVMSLDAELQDLAQQLLAGRRGAIVALEPSSGEVLCLAGSPTYDASLFQGGISQANLQKLLQDPNKPLFKRTIGGEYAPGSTAKIVTAIAAAMAGKFDPNRRVVCQQFYQVGNRRLKCLGRHGSIAFEWAMVKSCNAYFADLALAAGPDYMRAAAAAVGFGEATGIDLPGEGRGTVPTEEWVQKHRNPPRWYPGDTVNFGIGQGELHATPIQMASLAALVANSGISYRPRLVRALVPPQEGAQPIPFLPEQVRKVDLPSSFWTILRRALARVATEGTAAGYRLNGVTWAGKTGSAERRGQALTHSWFVAYAPAEQPKIAVAVIIEGAGHGSDVAVPFARDLVQAYFKKPQSSGTEKTPRISVTEVLPASSPESE